MNIKELIYKTKEKVSAKPQRKKVEDLFTVTSNSSKRGLVKGDSDIGLHNYGDKKDDSVVISYVNDILLNAFRLGASDIHIEPRIRDVQVRFRIDGNFNKYKSFHISHRDSIIARLKIMSYLRIDEHRLPQDGKINYKLYGEKTIDMRVSIIPTIYGEKIVIRILKKDEKPPNLKKLGILPYNMVVLKKHLKDPYGMILAVGPTGSGKSTTLFGLLTQFNAKDRNISTLEDPVEYRIKGVNHTQINTAIDFNFAKGLRSLLRQDPDIIMVGEIRDEETAKLAVEASITGHIVFSTLHTNSAVHTIQRLVNLGVDPLLISSSMRIIISQRLARKLCTHCKIKYLPNDKIKSYIVGKVGKFIKDKEYVELYKSKQDGCNYCNNTGYKGRIGLYEILEMNDAIEEIMLKGGSRIQLEIQAIGDGMVPIKEDALLKVVLGDTSIEEVLAVLGN